MTTDITNIEYIKSLRKQFLIEINEKSDFFIGNFEFIQKVVSVSNLNIFDFIDYYFYDKTRWKDNL